MHRYARTVNSLKQEREKIRPINKARKEEEGLQQKPGPRGANSMQRNMEFWAPWKLSQRGDWWIRYILLNNNRTQTNILGEIHPLPPLWDVRGVGHLQKRKVGTKKNLMQTVFDKNWTEKSEMFYACVFLHTIYSLRPKRKQKRWGHTVVLRRLSVES